MTSLTRRLGLALVVVVTSTCIALAPAFANDNDTPAPDPTVTTQVTDEPSATPSDEPSTPPTDEPTSDSPSADAPVSEPPTATSADGQVIDKQTTSNGISLTTIAAPEATDDSSVALAADGTLVTRLDATDGATFSMIAFHWQTTKGAPVTLYAQNHTATGWSDWYSFATTGTDVLAGEDGQPSTDAIWVGVSDGLRVQAIGGANSAITGLEAVLIDTTTGAKVTIQPTFASINLDNFIQMPSMVTRAQWGALPQNGTCDTVYDDTDIAVTIHHTAGSNDYTAAQSAGIVQGIQAYHMSQTWCDIGYNFLVDKYGTIFEGRKGGADLPVHGAHAGNWNTETIGIAFMMDATVAKPTAVALSSAEQLIAWKLANNYRDPLGTVTIAGKTLNTIFMHKDVLPTACPGQYIEAQMGNIRNAVAALINASEHSPIEDKWISLGGATGSLGQPFRLEQPIATGRYTQFNNGSIYWSPATAAYYMPTVVASVYSSPKIGGPAGKLGFPTSDPYTDSLGQTRQDFQGGYITYTVNAGVIVNYPDGTTYSLCSASASPTDPAQCGVNFDAAGGVVQPDSILVSVGSAFGALPTPTRAGFTFKGWYSQPTSGGTKYTSASVLSAAAETVLYAQWTGNKYKVTFNANGGTSPKTSGKVTSSKTVTMGTIYGTLPTTGRTGYSFAGWFTAKSGGTKVTSSTSDTIVGAHTLYAHWTAKTYTVYFKGNGGSVSPSSVKVSYAGKYAGMPTPKRTGYVFKGWFTRTSGGTRYYSSTTVKLTANQTLYAHWAKATYKVSFNSEGGSKVSAKTVTYHNRYGTLRTPSRTGYKFLGWYTSPTGGSKRTSGSTVNITSNTTLYAHWQGIARTVKFNANGGKTPSKTSKSVRYGSTYGALPTTSRANYVFAGWWTAKSGGSQVTSASVFKKTATQTLYAHWKLAPATLTVTSRSVDPVTGDFVVQYKVSDPNKLGYAVHATCGDSTDNPVNGSGNLGSTTFIISPSATCTSESDVNVWLGGKV